MGLCLHVVCLLAAVACLRSTVEIETLAAMQAQMPGIELEARLGNSVADLEPESLRQQRQRMRDKLLRKYGGDQSAQETSAATEQGE